jgi:hypothetical protein
MTDLTSRREAATEALEEAHRLAGVALLDGGDPDVNAIIKAENELQAITAAEAEQVRRERQAAREAAAKDRAEARKEARRAHDTIVAALTRAEETANALTTDLAVIMAAVDRIVGLNARLGGSLPSTLVAHEARRDLSRLLGGELNALGHPSGFGDLSWPSVPSPDWKAYAARISAALEPITMETPE